MKKGFIVIVLSVSLSESLSAASWTPPQEITVGTPERNVTSVYDATTNNLVALWVSSSAPHDNFYSLSTNNGASWQAAAPLNSSIANSVTNVFGANDTAHGVLVATWAGNNANTPATSVVSTNGGSTWGTLQQAGSAATNVYVTYEPGRSQLFAVWGNENSPFSPEGAISTNGGTSWGTPVQISTIPTLNDALLLMILPRGASS